MTTRRGRLLARVRSGDPSAADALVEAHRSLALSIGGRYGVPESDVERALENLRDRLLSDPPMDEHKFSTFATWWLRRGMVR